MILLTLWHEYLITTGVDGDSSHFKTWKLRVKLRWRTGYWTCNFKSFCHNLKCIIHLRRKAMILHQMIFLGNCLLSFSCDCGLEFVVLILGTGFDVRFNRNHCLHHLLVHKAVYCMFSPSFVGRNNKGNTRCSCTSLGIDSDQLNWCRDFGGQSQNLTLPGNLLLHKIVSVNLDAPLQYDMRLLMEKGKRRNQIVYL